MNVNEQIYGAALRVTKRKSQPLKNLSTFNWGNLIFPVNFKYNFYSLNEALMSDIKFLHITNKGMAFDPQTGDSFQLNEPAKMILELLQDKIEEEEILKKITNEFQISHERAFSDLLEFKIQLKILGIVI